MKVLIAITSCHSQRHFQDSQRNTWLRDVVSKYQFNVEYRFFLGQDATMKNYLPADDEVFLNLPDTIEYCTHKTIMQCRWAGERNYDFIFKCDPDTMVRPKLLLDSDFGRFDHLGAENGEFISGGAGYWLSRGAFEVVASQPFPNPPRADEDVFVSKTVRDAGLRVGHDPRFKFLRGSTLDGAITFHIPSAIGLNTATGEYMGSNRAKYTPELMYQVYAGVIPVNPRAPIRLGRR
jgi:hypothetical protein